MIEPVCCSGAFDRWPLPPLPAWLWLKPSANCEDCTGRFPIWVQKGTKGYEKDRKGTKRHKRDQKGLKGIVSSNYVRGMVEGSTGSMQRRFIVSGLLFLVFGWLRVEGYRLLFSCYGLWVGANSRGRLHQTQGQRVSNRLRRHASWRVEKLYRNLFLHER